MTGLYPHVAALGTPLDRFHFNPALPTVSPSAPPVSANDMTPGDYILLGNDIVMQWWAALNNKQPVPLQPTNVITTSQVQQTTMLLIVGAVIIGAVVLSRR